MLSGIEIFNFLFLTTLNVNVNAASSSADSSTVIYSLSVIHIP